LMATFTGKTTEVGIWPSAFSNGNLASIDANQQTYWGI
jgi:hypothetical protein